MALSNKRRKMLTDIGKRLLTSLDEVARLARSQLIARGSGGSQQVLAAGTNPMVDGQRAGRNLAAIRLQELHELKRIEREPFVARVVVLWEDEEPAREETLYFSRASAAGIGSEIAGIKLATYGAPLGRLAEFEPGETLAVRIGGRDREAFIKERLLLRPDLAKGFWDALDDSFEFEEWKAGFPSLLEFLRDTGVVTTTLAEAIPDVFGDLLRQDEEVAMARWAVRRKVIDRMALRDQAVLDHYQGEIFRMPLNQRLLLLGPPGTGKTTTLIRRLAQKRTPGALTSDELSALSAAALDESSLYSNSWAMFAPNELLKVYLRDAFNREGVPAAENLKTWDKERLHLGRNVLRILRSAESGRFRFDDSTVFLSDRSSRGLCDLYGEFASYFEKATLERCSNAFQQLQLSDDQALRAEVERAVGSRRSEELLSVRQIAGLLSQGSELQPVLKRLEDGIREEVRGLFNRLVYENKALLDELAASPSVIRDERDDEDDESDGADEEPAGFPKETRGRDEKRMAADALMAALRSKARSLAIGQSTVGGRAGRIIAFLGDRFPPSETLSELGTRIVTAARLRTVIQSPRLFVMDAPRAYGRFRRERVNEPRLYRTEAADAIKQTAISPGETDVVILTMLRNTRRLLREGASALAYSSSHDWLENIRSQHLSQVFVDEATDFSAVQLACTMELAHPRLRSWFACGDLNQRITVDGVRGLDEIDWLARAGGDAIETRQVAIAYRQSRRLRELAIALSAEGIRGSAEMRGPEQSEDADMLPLLAEGLSDGTLAGWLSERITDIERAVGKLPSIAVLVDSGDHIDPLVAAVGPLLAERNIPVVGYKDGRAVGDDLEVRVFEVRHIKGLEFEAVFFVGIDRLADRLPDLFDRFFYVGVSRAATYLGVTCEGRLPPGLERVRGHFGTGGW
jgi:hypothetical protein